MIKEGWNALEQAEGGASLDRYLLKGSAHEISESHPGPDVSHGGLSSRDQVPIAQGTSHDSSEPGILRQFLRELGTRIARPTTITMGGAASLVLQGRISRATEDIDLVDEVPVEIREERQILEELSSRYGLRVAHFQGHYLPERWQTRTTDLGSFGKIQVRLVDPHDIIAGKVYSPRSKDLDDFRLLAPGLEQGTAERTRDRGILIALVRRRNPAKGDPELVRGLW